MRKWLVMDEKESRRWIILLFMIGHRFALFRDTPIGVGGLDDLDELDHQALEASECSLHRTQATLPRVHILYNQGDLGNNDNDNQPWLLCRFWLRCFVNFLSLFTQDEVVPRRHASSYQS
jgi:hypothetical protein